jgi:hypothetical protein
MCDTDAVFFFGSIVAVFKAMVLPGQVLAAKLGGCSASRTRRAMDTQRAMAACV